MQPEPAISESEAANPGPVYTTMESWKRLGQEICFDVSDHDLLDLVLYVVPDLRVTAYIGKWARSRGLEYPVRTLEQLTELLGEERFEVADFAIDAKAVV